MEAFERTRDQHGSLTTSANLAIHVAVGMPSRLDLDQRRIIPRQWLVPTVFFRPDRDRKSWRIERDSLRALIARSIFSGMRKNRRRLLELRIGVPRSAPAIAAARERRSATKKSRRRGALSRLAPNLAPAQFDTGRADHIVTGSSSAHGSRRGTVDSTGRDPARARCTPDGAGRSKGSPPLYPYDRAA